MTTGKLIEKAKEYHNIAMEAIRTAGKDSDKKTKTTYYINAEYTFGKYHGIMEILEEEDLDEWIKLEEELDVENNEFLRRMDEQYYM